MKFNSEVKSFDSLNVGKKSKINEKNLPKAYAVLSSVYKNPIRSIIREYTSNAIDANIEAGRADSPVIVSFSKDEGESYYLKIKDVGPGIDPQFAEDVYFNYLDTTRDQSNDFHGAYGMGAKSVLSYTSMMNVVSVVKKEDKFIEYTYIFYYNQKAEPEHQLMLEKEIDATQTGTTIIIKVKPSDVYQFEREAVNTLMFFHNVVLLDEHGNNLLKDYLLFDFKHFKTSNGLSTPAVLLENVPYSLDKEELGITSDYIPNIALKFNTGELIPTPSRESFYYTKDAVERILDKIEKAREELYQFSCKKSEIWDYSDIKLSVIGSPLTGIKLSESYILPIGNFIEKLYLKLMPFEDIFKGASRRMNFNRFSPIVKYRCAYKMDPAYAGAEFLESSVIPSEFFRTDSKKKFSSLLIPHGKPSGIIKKYYLKDMCKEEGKTFLLFKPSKPTLQTYIEILSLEKFPKRLWRDLIIAHQKLESLYLNDKDLIDYDSISVPESWKKENSHKWTPNLERNSTFTFKSDGILNIMPRIRGDRNEYVWGKDYISEKNLKNHFVVYGTPEESSTLETIKFFEGILAPKVIVTKMSKRNIKYIQHLDNFLNTTEFMNQFDKQLAKAATAWYIHDRLSEFSKVIRKNLKFSKNIWSCYKNLEDVLRKYYIPHKYSNSEDIRLIKAIHEKFKTEGKLIYPWLSDLAKVENFIQAYDPLLQTDIYKGYYSYEPKEVLYYTTKEALKRRFYNIQKDFPVILDNLKLDPKLYLKDKFNEVKDFKPTVMPL